MGYMKTPLTKQSEKQVEPAKSKAEDFKPKQMANVGSKVKVPTASVDLKDGKHSC